VIFSFITTNELELSAQFAPSAALRELRYTPTHTLYIIHAACAFLHFHALMSAVPGTRGVLVVHTENLEALPVDDRGSRLVVLLLGDPHLLEGG